MYNIQYEAVNGSHQMQTFDGSRFQLLRHVARFERPIVAIYEQTTPITKAIRNDLRKTAGLPNLSTSARQFLAS
jgi:hypothetical protein